MDDPCFVNGAIVVVMDRHPKAAAARAQGESEGAQGNFAAAQLTNDSVAAALERVADLLEVGDASGYRVRAYRTAAETVRRLTEPVADVAARGHPALVALPGIGDRIASAIEEMLRRGTFTMLQRLEGETAPEALLASVPGLGPELAHRIHDTLGITTLEELELAAHDGRLARVRGFGPRRIQGLRTTLDSILRRAGRRRARQSIAERDAEAPADDLLLELDAEYRRRAAAGRLRTIAPRRFNPQRRAWLPIWHTERDGWEFDLLFSNTARAHELGKTGDWVVIYYGHDGHQGQGTVVTDRAGRRTVRR